MNMLKLPLWNLFERIWKSQFESLEFGVAEYWVTVFLLLVAAFLVFLLGYMIYRGIYDAIDKKRATIESLSGRLIDKRYKCEETHHGTGTVVASNTNGGMNVGVVSTTSHSPEEFLFFIQADIVYKVEVDMQVFYKKNIGDKLIFERTIGGLSKQELHIQLA